MDAEGETVSMYEIPRTAGKQQNVVLIKSATLRKAEQLIESCEHCNPDGAEIPFDNILDSRYRFRS